MKLRESGMPEEAFWESLFNIELILDQLGVTNSLHDVAELGSGYGTFTIPVAKRISGTIDTIDIDPEMVKRTCERVRKAGLHNVLCYGADILKTGFKCTSESKNACLLFNILHGEEPLNILNEAMRVVRPDGFVFVIHWRSDINTPRGPSIDIRPRPEQIISWAQETKLLRLDSPVIDLPPWHYGIRLKRINAK